MICNKTEINLRNAMVFVNANDSRLKFKFMQMFRQIRQEFSLE